MQHMDLPALGLQLANDCRNTTKSTARAVLNICHTIGIVHMDESEAGWLACVRFRIARTGRKEKRQEKR